MGLRTCCVRYTKTPGRSSAVSLSAACAWDRSGAVSQHWTASPSSQLQGRAERPGAVSDAGTEGCMSLKVTYRYCSPLQLQAQAVHAAGCKEDDAGSTLVSCHSAMMLLLALATGPGAAD